MDLLTGYKAIIGGIGLIALGIYQMTQGEVEQGIQSIASGLGIIGIRAALDRPN